MEMPVPEIVRVITGTTGPAGPQGPTGPQGPPGTVADGNKGDITISGAGSSFEINAGVVGSSELASNLALAGNPTAPTPSAFDSTTKLATTAFIDTSYARKFPNPGSAQTSLNTAGAVSYTAAQVLTGEIVRDPNGAARTDTLPTAAALVAAISGAAVNMRVKVLIINGADAAETITIQAGTGGTFDANQTAASRVIPQNAQKIITMRLTNVTSGTEAYDVYG